MHNKPGLIVPSLSFRRLADSNLTDKVIDCIDCGKIHAVEVVGSTPTAPTIKSLQFDNLCFAHAISARVPRPYSGIDAGFWLNVA